jgi:hypothetical protein
MVTTILKEFIEVTVMFTCLTAFPMINNTQHSESEAVKPCFLARSGQLKSKVLLM